MCDSFTHKFKRLHKLISCSQFIYNWKHRLYKSRHTNIATYTYRNGDIVCVFATNERAVGRMSLMFDPRFVGLLPTDETHHAGEAHGAVIAAG